MEGGEESKPKSRLMAMKNRLRSKPKKDDAKGKAKSKLVKSQSSEIILKEDTNGKIPGNTGYKLARSRTFEGQLETSPKSPTNGKPAKSQIKSKSKFLFSSKHILTSPEHSKVTNNEPARVIGRAEARALTRSQTVDSGDCVQHRGGHPDMNVQMKYGNPRGKAVNGRLTQDDTDKKTKYAPGKAPAQERDEYDVPPPVTRLVKPQTHPPGYVPEDYGRFVSHGSDLARGPRNGNSQPITTGPNIGSSQEKPLSDPSMDPRTFAERNQAHISRQNDRYTDSNTIPDSNNRDAHQKIARSVSDNLSMNANIHQEISHKLNRPRDFGGQLKPEIAEKPEMVQSDKGIRQKQQPFNVNQYYIQQAEVKPSQSGHTRPQLGVRQSNSSQFYDRPSKAQVHRGHQRQEGRPATVVMRRERSVDRIYSSELQRRDKEKERRQSRSLENLIACNELREYAWTPAPGRLATQPQPNTKQSQRIQSLKQEHRSVVGSQQLSRHVNKAPLEEIVYKPGKKASPAEYCYTGDQYHQPPPRASSAERVLERVRGRAERRGSDPQMINQDMDNPNQDEYGFKSRRSTTVIYGGQTGLTSSGHRAQADKTDPRPSWQDPRQCEVQPQPKDVVPRRIGVAALKAKKAGGGLRVTNPEDLRQRAPDVSHSARSSPTAVKTATARRHTVTVADMLQDGMGEQHKQETAFYEHLAKRFPEHAHIIRSRNGAAVLPGRGPDPRLDGQRRRTTQVTYNPHQVPFDPTQNQFVYEDDRMSTHSEADTSPTGAFHRGIKLRNSLPVVRSPNKSLDRPLGMVFLIHRNETKRALLPNEVTSLDTVRALFVRAFPDTLNMLWFENPNRKVYVMDMSTNVYYELEDLRDVKDKAVLKVYEKDVGGSIPGSPLRSPKVREGIYGQGYESDSSVRSAPAAPGPRSPIHVLPNRPYSQDVTSKTTSLPVQPNYAYQQQMQHYGVAGHPPGYQSPTTAHWSPTHRPLSQGQYSCSQQSSPQRSAPPAITGVNNQRHSVAYLPDPTSYPPGQLPQSRSYHDYHDPDNRSSGSVTPTHDNLPIERMDKMEAQLANLAAWVQTAVMHKNDGSRPSSARSNSSVVSDGSYSAKSKSESTTPTIQSPTSSTQQGMSDLSSSTPQPLISVDMQNSIRNLNQRAKDLRSEVNKLRKLQLANAECMRETIHETFTKIKEVMSAVPGVDDQPIRSQRYQLNAHLHNYRDDSTKVQQDLSDLESTVEELRNDVVNRRCRVNLVEVESMALALSNISKALAELKGKFPDMQEDMKGVMAGEMEVVVQEERFIKDEPIRLEESLKRCKKLTGTLFTLKRLASVQDQRPPSVPRLEINADVADEDRKAVLENIQAVVPNHEARLNSVEAAESSIERKKKLLANAESLRFEKSLAIAQKKLKETRPGGGTSDKLGEGQDSGDKSSETQSDTAAGQPDARANIPLTETTKRISLLGSPDHQKPPLAQPESDSDLSELDRASEDGAIPSGQCQGPAPLKPPRVSDYSEIQTVKGNGVNNGLVATQQLGNSAPASPSALRLSTFSPAAATTATAPMYSSTPGKPPLAPPGATSTPKQVHVTFSSNITEIKDNALTEGAAKPKKIPPPPPPRRSSRNPTAQPPSPEHATTSPRPPSPHTYENIEDLMKNNNGTNGAKVKGNGILKGQTTGKGQARPKSVSDLQQPGKSTSSPPRPKSEYSPTKNRPNTRYQHELASGIYANMNRPDLKDQKARPADIAENSPKRQPGDRLMVKEGSPGESGSSSSIDSQIGGIVRKIHATNGAPPKDRTPPTMDTNISKKEVRKPKVPPPPPVRKTSALTTSTGEPIIDTSPQDQYKKIDNAAKEQAPVEKFQNGSKLVKPKLSNGNLPQKTSNKTVTIVCPSDTKGNCITASKTSRKFEETEIY